MQRSQPKVRIGELTKTTLLMGCLQHSPRPVVRFCDLSKYIKDDAPTEKEQPSPQPTTLTAPVAPVMDNASSATFFTSTSGSDDSMDVEINGVDEEKELDDDLWEDDSEEEEADHQRLAEVRELASSSVMDIEEDEGVDVGVPDLSDQPALRTSVGVEPQPKPAKKVTNSQIPKVFQISDIQF